MSILLDLSLVLLGIGIGIALVTLRTAQSDERAEKPADAEFTSERLEQ